MATRLAIFSDVHSNLPAMEATAKAIRAGGYDAAYCLGDLGGYASEPNEVQQLVETMGCPVVLGNYDEGVGFNLADCGCHYIKPFDIEMSNISFKWTCEHTREENKTRLRAFPREIRLDVEGRRILLCHGSPASTTEYLFENRSDGYLRQFTPGGKHDARADVIVFGHTHVPYHRQVNGVDFVNTGSVGRPKDGDPRAGYCVLTVDGGNIEAQQVRVDYDVELTCARLTTAGLPIYFAEYLRKGGIV